MRVGGGGREVVDGDDFDVGAVRLLNGAEHEAANTAKSIDSDANGH